MSMKRVSRVAMMMAAMTATAVFPARTVQAQVENVSAGDPQVKDDLFAGTEKFEQGASDVTNVNLDGKMLGMVGSKGKSDLAHKLNFVVVHSFTYDKPGMYRMEDVDAYRKKLTDGTWNCFIHTRDKDGTTDICSRTLGDNETHELVIMTAEPKELTFVHLSGKMTLDDLGKMGGSVGVPDGALKTRDKKDKSTDQ